MHHLEQFFRSLHFKEEDLSRILAAFTLRIYRKNDFVVTEGTTSKEIGFVESGLFQYFVLMDGVERTTYISTPNTFVASVHSFVSEKPALENIRLLTDGSANMISKTKLRKLIDEVPAFKDFYIGMLEQTMCSIDETRHDLIVLTAEQRYEKMLRNEPHLLQQIPLQHLASILGVTPRHLSRIRNIR